MAEQQVVVSRRGERALIYVGGVLVLNIPAGWRVTFAYKGVEYDIDEEGGVTPEEEVAMCKLASAPLVDTCWVLRDVIGQRDRREHRTELSRLNKAEGRKCKLYKKALRSGNKKRKARRKR